MSDADPVPTESEPGTTASQATECDVRGRRIIQADPHPLVWCVAGSPGSGKSTLGAELARTVQGVLLDQDTLTNPLMARIAELVGAGDDLDHPELGGPVRSARYRCLIRVAADNLRLGRNVVMVAPFTQEIRDASAWMPITQALAPAIVHLVWVEVPPAVAAARRRARALPRDVAADLAGPHHRSADPPAVEHIRSVGTRDPIREAGRIVRLSRVLSPPR